MATLLFFDDFYLNRWENLRRRIGQPELVPEATFSDPEFWLASAYPTVFRDASGIWRCLYQGKPRAEPQEPRYPLLLESGDGVRWQAPDLTRAVPLDERRFREWDCYFDARAENPRERLKALVTHPSAGTSLWTSADGLRWRELPGVRGAPARPMPQHRVLERAAQLLRDQRPSDAAQPAATGGVLGDPRLAHVHGAGADPDQRRAGHSPGRDLRYDRVPLRGQVRGIAVDLPRGSAYPQQVCRWRHRLPARLQLQRLALPAHPA